MAYRIKIMPRAQRDLSAIYERIDARSSNAAKIWYRGLRAEIRTLSTYPNRCPTISESDDCRHLLYGNKPHIYRIIYRVMEAQKQVDVLHIRHGAMDEVNVENFV